MYYNRWDMRALVITSEPMHRIIDGPKSWEIRRGRCLIREMIRLIESASGIPASHLPRARPLSIDARP